MFHLIQRIVHEETQFGNNAQLMAQPLSQIIADGSAVRRDGFYRFLRPCGWEYAQIYTAVTQVWGNAAVTYRQHNPGHGLGLDKKHLTEFFLYETPYFYLSGGFHAIKNDYSTLLPGLTVLEVVTTLNDSSKSTALRIMP